MLLLGLLRAPLLMLLFAATALLAVASPATSCDDVELAVAAGASLVTVADVADVAAAVTIDAVAAAATAAAAWRPCCCFSCWLLLVCC